jgi:subtilisin family serine protease
MSTKLLKIFIVAMLVVLVTAAVASAAAPGEQSYIILSKTERISPALIAQIVAAGGKVTNTIDKIGVVVASSSDPTFPNKIAALSGVEAIAPNVKIEIIDPVEPVALENYGNPPNSGDDDFLFDLQWGHDAIDAVEAWQTKGRGAGVRVVVLDDGIDSDHPDLAPNLNVDLSTSFVPGETFEYIENYPGDPFSHGTHVSGTIAAADNGYGVIGVAPEAELVMVKVLSSLTGSGQFDWLLDALIYAADIDADVINMSLGARISEEDIESINDALDIAALVNALERAGRYANMKGATLIAAAGNDGEETGGPVYHLPSDIPRYLSISATAPIGWALDPNTNLDIPTFYTNYGRPIHNAAPGGNFEYYFVDPGQTCTVAGITRPCWVFDLVFSTGSAGRFYWSAGTSMAAPHASGVAALIIGAAGGDLNPGLVKEALRYSADDLGDRGKDPYFGWGRVNANNSPLPPTPIILP